MRFALLAALLLLAACVPSVECTDDDATEEPAPDEALARVTLEPETGATVEAPCPPQTTPVDGTCEPGPDVLLFGERLTERGYACTVWAEGDVEAQTAEARVTCERGE